MLPLLATSVLALSSGLAPTPSTDEALEERIELYLAPYVEAGHLSGTVLVAKDGEVVYEKAFGQSQRELGVRNTPATRHGIASISKSLTVALAVRLLEEQVVAIGDPISKWLPAFPRAERITVEHLLRHRAGIPHRVTKPLEEAAPLSTAQVVAKAAHVLSDESAFLCDPGETHNYSSAGYTVLVRILELASGKSYAQLLDHYVFQPAGMEDTFHVEGLELLERRAQPYLLGRTGYVNAPLQNLSFLAGAGSLYSTAHDLFRFVTAVQESALGASVRANLVDPDGSMDSNGATSGYRAYIEHHGPSGVTLIVTANLPTGALDRIRSDLPRIVGGADVELSGPPEVTPARIVPASLQRFEGRYEMRPGNGFDVRLEGGELFIGSYVLVPTGENRFHSFQDYTDVTARLDEEGRITGLDWGTLFMRRVN